MTPSNNSSSGSTPQSAGTPHPHSSCAHFQSVLRRNWHSGSGGIYAVCSAHPQVIHAAIQQSIADDSVLHVESTSSQVNQFGGYSRQTPDQFAQSVKASAQRAGLPPERVLVWG